MDATKYQTLRDWYLAKLRKAAIVAADGMTPSTLIAADRAALLDKLSSGLEKDQNAILLEKRLKSIVSACFAGVGIVSISAVSKLLEQFQGQIAELSERENAIADYGLDLIAAIDSSLNIAAINPAVQVHTGHPESALHGSSLLTLIYVQDQQKLEKALEEARTTAAGTQVELQVKSLSGAFKDFLWTIEWSESNSLFFCTARDITAEKELQRVKNEFIAMVSHDLRSPLMSVEITLQALHKFALEGIPEQYRAQLIAAQSSMRGLICLINDLLDLERMESGGMSLTLSDVMVQDAFEKAIMYIRELAAQKQIRIEYDPTELEFKADATRLEQVLVNLLSNAVKFSPSGALVKLFAIDSGRAIEIVVRDEGPGIAEEDRSRVFERFHQLKQKDSRSGSGLGLAICKNIAELHEGAVGVRPAPGGTGSEFWIKLPFRKI